MISAMNQAQAIQAAYDTKEFVSVLHPSWQCLNAVSHRFQLKLP
jgi:hypothetical protein